MKCFETLSLRGEGKKKSVTAYFIFNFEWAYERNFLNFFSCGRGGGDLKGRCQSKVSHVREGQVGKRPHKNKVRSYSLLILTVGGTSP